MVAGGYAVGKAGEAAGAGKAIDSPAFHAGLTSFLWSNGILPTIQYEPTGHAGRHNSLADNDIAQTPLLIANHISYLDGPVLAACFKSPKIVAKAGTRDVPFFGKLMQEMDTVFVDRGNGDSRTATLEAISGHCAAWRPGDRPMLIFPEGTTTNGEGLLNFKKGAFVPGVPVRPVIIVYTGQWDPANTTYHDGENGPEEMSDAEWGAQFLGHFAHEMHVRVLPPYVPNEAEKADPQLYAKVCQSYMAAELAHVRDELHYKSWKRAAGRTNGGLGFKAGDVVRVAYRQVEAGLQNLL
jgi:lysophosphatidylcholine acyltransferase/lyso-PAF acetyltransferase